MGRSPIQELRFPAAGGGMIDQRSPPAVGHPPRVVSAAESRRTRPRTGRPGRRSGTSGNCGAGRSGSSGSGRRRRRRPRPVRLTRRSTAIMSKMPSSRLKHAGHGRRAVDQAVDQDRVSNSRQSRAKARHGRTRTAQYSSSKYHLWTRNRVDPAEPLGRPGRVEPRSARSTGSPAGRSRAGPARSRSAAIRSEAAKRIPVQSCAAAPGRAPGTARRSRASAPGAASRRRKVRGWG